MTTTHQAHRGRPPSVSGGSAEPEEAQVVPAPPAPPAPSARKQEWVNYADAVGVDSSGTKQEIIGRFE